MKQFSIFLLLLTLTIPAMAEFAGVVTLSGYLKNKANGEALIGATVFIPELKTGVITNPYGFYSISVAPGIIQSTFLLSVTKPNRHRST